MLVAEREALSSMSMNAVLPDVSLSEAPSRLLPLQWVGMQGIDLPITLQEEGMRHQSRARADVQVDLPAAHAKGIHMSRLYRRLGALGDGLKLSPTVLRRMLQDLIESHADCASTGARLRLQFDLLVRRAALVTPGLSGWRSYPVRLDASLVRGQFELRAQITVVYSSTCPCSAALARQLVEQSFEARFEGQDRVERSTVAQWLREHASLATPHSQRSEAVVEIVIDADAVDLRLLGLIDAVEAAVATPVQTAVKRADEQAFAALNGQNLMFVEDAARRIQAALLLRTARPRVQVRHLESLHPHDAVAWAGPVEHEQMPEQPQGADA